MPPSHEEAVIEMLCIEAVEGELAELENQTFGNLETACQHVIENVENLPNGRFVVEEKCESWGSQHMHEVHQHCSKFMHKNCTAWAKTKLAVGNMTHGRTKHLFNSASNCLIEYGNDMQDDVIACLQLYEDAVETARNESGELLVGLKKKARDTMNQALKDMGSQSERKFIAADLVGVGTRPPSATASIVVAASLTTAALGLSVKLLRWHLGAQVQDFEPDTLERLNE